MLWKIILFVVLVTIAIVFLYETHIFSNLNIQPFLNAFRATSTIPTYSGSGGSGGSGGTGNGSAAAKEPPAGFAQSDLSSYFGHVHITAVRTPQFPSPAEYEEISISAELGSGKSVDLGEWYLASNRGIELIPYGVNSLDFALPEPRAPLSLQNGDALNVYSTVSPVGISFRLNACAGYLTNQYPFVPPFAAECPAVNRRDIVTFSGICQEYILSLNACEIPSPARPVPYGDFACNGYINSLNYQGCVNRHRYDPDFSKNEWSAWTGHRILDPLHDRVRLFDRKGLLVDEYVY